MKLLLSKYTVTEYWSRLTLSERMYFQLEDQFLDFLDYVPLSFKHMDVYSHRLITIILETGPEILSAFDLSIFHERRSNNTDQSIQLAREQLLKREQQKQTRHQSLTFKEYYDFLNTYPKRKLCQTFVGVYGINGYITPFEQLNSFWWDSYNKLKHDKYSYIQRATLRNTLKALSALFSLVNDNNQ